MNPYISLYSFLIILHWLCLAGAVVAGIWLAISGEWGAIGYGALGFFLCPLLVTIAAFPGALLKAMSEVQWERGGINKLVAIPVYASSAIWNLGVTTAWCISVFVFLGKQTGNPALLFPVALWSYGVACGLFLISDKKLEDQVEAGVETPKLDPETMSRNVSSFFCRIGCFALLVHFWFFKPSLMYADDLVVPVIVFAGIQLIGLVAVYFLFRHVSAKK